MNPSEYAAYAGPDRRVHRMFVTKNTEYHLRENLCIAVRDRHSNVWLEGHLAVGRRLTGAVRMPLAGSTAIPGGTEPRVGDALYFSDGHRQLVTSVLCAVDRPGRELALAYPD